MNYQSIIDLSSLGMFQLYVSFTQLFFFIPVFIGNIAQAFPKEICWGKSSYQHFCHICHYFAIVQSQSQNSAREGKVNMACILAASDDLSLSGKQLHKDVPEHPASCIKRPCPLQTSSQSLVNSVVFPWSVSFHDGRALVKSLFWPACHGLLSVNALSSLKLSAGLKMDIQARHLLCFPLFPLQ